MSARVVHQRCNHCGRLLVKSNGRFPPHRVPPPTPPTQGRGVSPMVPLTGKDRPWCAGGSSER